MVIGDLQHLLHYRGLSPHLGLAIDHIQHGDWQTKPEGRHEVDGSNVFFMVSSYQTALPAPEAYETHCRYLDIQVLLEGEEAIWVAQNEGLAPQQAYDESRDISFWASPASEAVMVPMVRNRFVVLFPSDAHAPCICLNGPKAVRKVVFKVLCERE